MRMSSRCLGDQSHFKGEAGLTAMATPGQRSCMDGLVGYVGFALGPRGTRAGDAFRAQRGMVNPRMVGRLVNRPTGRVEIGKFAAWWSQVDNLQDLE